MAPDPGSRRVAGTKFRPPSGGAGGGGIEVILDVVLNHSGKVTLGGQRCRCEASTIATYYRSLPGAPWRYADDPGAATYSRWIGPRHFASAMDGCACGLARRVCMGFASTSRPPSAGVRTVSIQRRPCLSAIAQDSGLRGLKLIAVHGMWGRMVIGFGSFPAPGVKLNDRFRDGCAASGAVISARSGSWRPGCQVRPIVSRRAVWRPGLSTSWPAHDGFTLTDSFVHGQDQRCQWRAKPRRHGRELFVEHGVEGRAMIPPSPPRGCVTSKHCWRR